MCVFSGVVLFLLLLLRTLPPSFLCAGPSGTNIIIGSIAGAILLAAIVLGGTGWGFK